MRVGDAHESTVIEVELLAFGNGVIRTVDIPNAEITKLENAGVTGERFRTAMLELIFYFGQNDFQPKPFPSVSVGDAVRYEGKRWAVKTFGFSEIPDGWVPPRDAEGRLKYWEL